VLPAKTEDRVFAALEKVMDKLNGLEERLQKKVDVKTVEELKQKMESTVIQVEKRLDEVKKKYEIYENFKMENFISHFISRYTHNAARSASTIRCSRTASPHGNAETAGFIAYETLF